MAKEPWERPWGERVRAASCVSKAMMRASWLDRRVVTDSMGSIVAGELVLGKYLGRWGLSGIG